ncbi:hypothetical protein [Sodalis sp.]|uniref:hypothetical protein n=1 Tax=Sodalis sp. (in: enterobacteria) TaxID=1898979 RepID=UPI003872F4D2
MVQTSSTLTHRLYLIIFILLGSLALQDASRHMMMFAMITGVTVLSVFTIAPMPAKSFICAKFPTAIPALTT